MGGSSSKLRGLRANETPQPLHETWLEWSIFAADASRMSRPDRTEAKAEFFKLLAQGVSVSAAARQVGVHNTVGYYWVKTAEPPAAVRFAELKPSSAVSHTPGRRSVEVVVGDAAIRVEAGFDAQLLRQVVSALSGEEQRSRTECRSTSR